MTTTRPDAPREKLILKAAFDTFAQYGYRRTSMEDIANAAGLSRPTLYQSFRNKEDLFRSLVRFYYADAVARVREALTSANTPSEALQSAFRAQAGQIKEVILTSPHGRELMDAGNATAADLVAEGDAQLAGIYVDWLKQGQAQGQMAADVAPEVMVDTMMHAVHGVKMPPHDAFLARLDTLALAFGRALTPR